MQVLRLQGVGDKCQILNIYRSCYQVLLQVHGNLLQLETKCMLSLHFLDKFNSKGLGIYHEWKSSTRIFFK
jgi:hypothetical protein